MPKKPDKTPKKRRAGASKGTSRERPAVAQTRRLPPSTPGSGAQPEVTQTSPRPPSNPASGAQPEVVQQKPLPASAGGSPEDPEVVQTSPRRGFWAPTEVPTRPSNGFWVPGFARNEQFQRHRVAIFGAGVGGLTAAQELAERGFKVHVFEMQGESRTGGLAASQWHLSTRASAVYEDLYPGLAKPNAFWLPAEHGFRFFPSFYCHVIDTMRRIPMWDRQQLDKSVLQAFAGRPSDRQFIASIEKAINTPLSAIQIAHTILELEQFRGSVDFFRPPYTVSNNLVATNKTGLVFDDGRVLEYDRRVPRSGQGAFAASILLELFGLGHEIRDMALMGTRMFQYLTSCRERRLAQYEKMTFWDFMQADRLSPTLQAQLVQFTRVLLAMDAQRGEARTVLNVLVRMLLDQGSQGTTTDRVMNGPTTERWIIPWVRHLEQDLDVDFHWCTKLVELKVDGGGKVVDASVENNGIKYETLNKFLGAEKSTDAQASQNDRGVPPIERVDDKDWHYFVTDLPVRSLWQVLGSSPGLLDADDKETAARPARCFPRDNPDPPLREIGRLVGDECNPWMTGIQFYLSDPIDLGVPGHVNFVESKWALSAIVQSQFWGPDFVSRYGGYVVRGILSVDIAECDAPGETTPKTLKELAL